MARSWLGWVVEKFKEIFLIVYLINIFILLIYLPVQRLIEESSKLLIGPLAKINIYFFYDLFIIHNTFFFFSFSFFLFLIWPIIPVILMKIEIHFIEKWLHPVFSNRENSRCILPVRYSLPSPHFASSQHHFDYFDSPLLTMSWN